MTSSGASSTAGVTGEEVDLTALAERAGCGEESERVALEALAEIMAGRGVAVIDCPRARIVLRREPWGLAVYLEER